MSYSVSYPTATLSVPCASPKRKVRYRISVVSYFSFEFLLVELLLPQMEDDSQEEVERKVEVSFIPIPIQSSNSIYLSQPFAWYNRPFVVEPEKTKVADISAPSKRSLALST